MREDRVAEDAVAQRAVDSLAQTVAVVVLLRLLRDAEVVVACLQNEAQVVLRRCHSEVVDKSHVEAYVVVLCLARLVVALVEQHFAVLLQVYEVGVRRGDYGCSLMAVGLAGDLYVQLLGDAALELYGDMVGVDILLALFERVWRKVFYHLQLIF